MTTTTETTATRTCPPSAVVDMIVRWQDVQTGDLVLLDDCLVVAALVEVIERPWGDGTTFPSVDIRHQLDNGHFVVSARHGDRYTAVQRYTEGPSEADQLRAELDQFKPQPMSQNCRDGKHNGSTGERCCNCWCLCHRGEMSREQEALVLAALDEAAADREYRARGSGCAACATATSAAEEAGELDVFRADERDPFAGLCAEHREHAERAAEYRAERDRREAGR